MAEQSRFAIETGKEKQGVCEIGLRNLKRASKRSAATLTIECPDAFVEQLIRQSMRQSVDKRITHVWLGWRATDDK